MVVVPGTSVTASFYSFTGQYPPLYYSSGEGSLNLASVNAGNSDGLCVGLGGINAGFYSALTKAGQSGANLDPQPEVGGQKGCSPLPTTLDDYQGRHQNLMAKAGNGGTAFEAYSTTNPTAFSFANSTQVNSVSGWHDGVCFADIFDPKLCPAGNARNMSMLYVAPPYGQNYADKTTFLAAIQATAENMIATVAGYNAIAGQHGQPVIEALRNCLFSSNNYAKPGVTHDEVARAIFAGVQAGLQKAPQSGLKEVQFPVNPGGAPLFDAVQADLSPHAVPPVQAQGTTAAASGFAESAPTEALWEVPGGVFGKPTGHEDSVEDDNDNDDDPDAFEMNDLGQGTDPSSQQVNKMPVENASNAVDQGATADNKALEQGKPSSEYGIVGQFDPGFNYDDASSPFMEQFPSAAVDNAIEKLNGAGDVTDPLNRAKGEIKQEPGRTDTPTVLHARQAWDQCKSALAEAQDYRDAKKLSAKKKVVTRVAAELSQARRAVEAAEAATDDKNYNEGNKHTQELDKEVARAARENLTETEKTYDILVKDYNEAKEQGAIDDAKKRKTVAKVSLFVTVIGSLANLWVFLFGFGRKVVKVGPGRFETSDITVDAPASDTTVNVDVLQVLANQTGTAKLAFIQAVELVDDKGAPLSSTGGWSVSGLDINYAHTAGDTTPAEVHFVLVGAALVVPAKTDPAKLTINFKAKVMPVDDPTDIVQAADDRKAAVVFQVPSGFRFQTESNGDGWTYDAKSGSVTFAPASAVSDSVLVKAKSFRLTPDGKTAKLVVLYTPAALSGTISRTAAFDYPALETTADGVTAELTLGSGANRAKTLDATATVDGKSVTVGTWSVRDTMVRGAAKSGISFEPNEKLTDSVAAIDAVSFAVMYGGARSGAAQITATLPAAGAAPVAKDVTKVTGNRSARVIFPIVGGALTGTTSDANGAWSVNSAKTQILYTPTAGLAAGEVNASVSYTVTDAKGTSAPAKLTVTLLPEPADITNDKVSRVNATNKVDVTHSPAIASDYSVQLWHRGQATNGPVEDASSQGFWSVSEGSKVVVFTKATGPIDPAQPNGQKSQLPFTTPSASVKYVLVGADGVSDKAGDIKLDFEKTNPHAYALGETVMSIAPSHTVRLSDHIIVPAGLKAIYLGDRGTRTTAGTNTETFEVVDLATNPGIKVTPVSGQPTQSKYIVTYRIVDNNDSEAGARLIITVDSAAMPEMRNFLLAVDVAGGKAAALNVMDNAASFFKPDPKTLIFVGLNDVSGDGLPGNAMIKKDGKAISVPGEGTWMISDEHAVVFQADKALTGAPTPALVRYSDVKGNTSNTATILIDPALSALKSLDKTVSADDTTFWSGYLRHLLQASPPVAPNEFIAATAALKSVAQSQLKRAGKDPVSDQAFAAAYKTWDDAGQPTDPGDGDGTNDILALSRATVQTGLGTRTGPFLERFWTLNMIARMAAHALPDGS